MPVRATVRERCRALLAPGEDVRYLFPVESHLTNLGLFGRASYLVAVTDRRIAVLACTWYSRHRPVRVWASHPRGTRLGPVRTEVWGCTFTLGGFALDVDEEYVSVLRAADAELAAELAEADPLPPDPLPDL